MSKDTRRRSMGSVRKLPSGKYLATIERGVKADGSRRTMSKACASKVDAESWIAQTAIQMGERPDLGAGITLEVLWKIYKGLRLPELAKSTQTGYVYLMDHVVLPALGSMDASRITHADIQRMFDGMSPSTARYARAALSAVLSFAVRSGLLYENVMRRASFVMPERSVYADPDADIWDADPFAAIEDRRDVWSTKTVGECLRRIRGLTLEPVWLVCVGGGLRVEEAFALRKIDVRRIVATYDDLGREIWVTQLAVHHATTREEARKTTKTNRSVGIVPMLEPFGERFWELVEALPDRQSPVCGLSASRQNKTWRSYFEEPKEYHKRMAESRKVCGRLHGLPYIPLSRMRATHTTMVQDAGILDSINQSMHRNTGAVQQKHYMRPDVTSAAVRVSKMLDI